MDWVCQDSGNCRNAEVAGSEVGNHIILKFEFFIITGIDSNKDDQYTILIRGWIDEKSTERADY